MMAMLTTLRTLTTVAIATITTIGTAVTTITTIATLTTLRALTTGRTLYIVSGLLDQYTVRELVLTSLRIDLQQLHLDLVTLLDASLLDSLEALPVNLGDMEQTILTRHDLNEATVRHDATNGSLIDLTYLGDSHDSLDLGDSSIDAFLVRSRNLNLTNTLCLIDCDSSTSILLHLLDNLATRADDSTDELLRNIELNNTGNLRFHLCTRLCDGVGEALQDVLTTSLGLHKSFLKNIKRQTVALNIHLGSSQTILCTSGLEVHITQVVLITEDIAQYCILIFAWILDQTHSNT